MREQGGRPALHTAVALGYHSVIQFLAEHGANMNAKNSVD
jgi:ankyrin repeat protein